MMQEMYDEWELVRDGATFNDVRQGFPPGFRTHCCGMMRNSIHDALMGTHLRVQATVGLQPATLLCAPTGGGKRHAKAAAAFTRDRMQRWLASRRAALAAGPGRDVAATRILPHLLLSGGM